MIPARTRPGQLTHYSFALARCIVFDLEVFPGRWLLGFYWIEDDGKPQHRIIEDRLELARFLTECKQQDKILVGYNSDAYDRPMVRAILANKDIWKCNEGYFQEDDRGRNRHIFDVDRCPAFGPDHVDLCLRFKRGRNFTGLKTLAARLGRPSLMDLPFPPGTVLDDA